VTIDPSITTERCWRVRLIVSDLDGTLVETYRTLEGLHHIMQELGKCVKRPNDAIKHYTDRIRGQIQMPDILHAPDEALPQIVNLLVKAEGEAGRIEGGTPRNGTKVHIDSMLEQGLAMAHDSFKAYSGATRVMDDANTNGTGFIIHTATKAESAVRRLTRSTELNPDHVSLIFARTDDEEGFNLPWRKNLTDPRAIAFAEKVVPYIGKKSFEQVTTMLRMFDVAADEMLYVGESATDYSCIKGPHGYRLGYFAYQEVGARMSPNKLLVNDHLREHRLGHAHFIEKHPRMYTNPHVIVLKKGWETLHEAMAKGQIVLEDLLDKNSGRQVHHMVTNWQEAHAPSP
jgi:phosphoglycolate phosphatase-like HAD superfamily hydrolase